MVVIKYSIFLSSMSCFKELLNLRAIMGISELAASWSEVWVAWKPNLCLVSIKTVLWNNEP